MNAIRIRTALLLLTTVLAGGCGSGLNDVTGKVTLDGRPVPKLELRFEPIDPSIGTTAIGYTQADGTYRLHYPGDKTGTPAGEYKVSISGGDSGGEGGKPVRVARKYNSETTLTATVKPGPNVLDFEVTSESGAAPKKNPQGD